MRVSPSALPLLLLISGASAFTTPTFLAGPHSHQSSIQRTDAFASSPCFISSPFFNSSAQQTSTRSQLQASFLGQDDDDEDDDTPGVLDESKFVQKMSPEERRENLEVMKQLFKYDLADLQRRRDYAGWVEAKKDLRKREANDPWFALNKRMKDAVQMDEMDEAENIKKLIEKVGGPPPGVKQIREYALITEIYSTPMSLSRAESISTGDQKRKNTETWKRMMAERKANEEAEEEEYRQNPYKDEEEAKIRRERSMKKMYAAIEETRKQAEAKAKDIQAKYREESGDMENMTPLDRALAVARKAVEKKAAARKQRKLESAKVSRADVDDDDDDDESATTTKKKSSSTDSSGRPRLPGDIDVTRGEIEVDISSSSDVITDDLQVQVSSDYSASQSDPPMRKHCFQYTIKITNKSTTDTIQLLSRRFEIQTVGARQKDVVQGQGVTGRQPVLKPGETFEYTSTAPLSVRPIGTTIIAARMKGTYSYSVVDENVKEEERDEKEAALGIFYFVFPPEQRVKPVTYDDDDDDEDEDEDEEDDVPVATSAPKAPAAASPSSSSSSSSTLNPPTTLPGDEDMITGEVPVSSVQDSSETVSDSVRVAVTSQYREERSDSKLQKHCFAYNIRITNERTSSIQLVSRRFEIQTIGSQKKDVIQGPGVTGRQPILQPGESFEYTSTAPLSVKPVESTPVVARMSGEYSFVVLGDDGKSPLSSEALKAKLGVFHFILPQLA